MKRVLLAALFASALIFPAAKAEAQFVWPRPEYTQPEAGVYELDPFIDQYRRRFFAVFRGDFATFEAAFREIQAMVDEDPDDPRALVWLGNGQTVRAGLLHFQGREREARLLFTASNRNLDRAVTLAPDDPNIYMMRAATLYVQGQYLPEGYADRATWERLRDDCLRFIEFIGEDRLMRVSIHMRGETFASLGHAYQQLGEYEKARTAFARLLEIVPGTTYIERAQERIDELDRLLATAS